MFNLFIKSNTLFRAISGVFSASQPQPNGYVCDAANETTRLGFAEQRYWLHGIFWSIESILPIKTQNSKLKTLGRGDRVKEAAASGWRHRRWLHWHRKLRRETVSYTHLTLPTILRV